ncbi:MAG: phosphoribosylformylglycinamidine synthase subunit PurS, partial [Candidatus Gracilibacteria bacterium]|nr:phosphoribosylformylglycinamidine synthase subunit PurS [Candidatus Gracilibacteria bacterium]
MILKLSEPFLDQPALKKRFTREFEGLKNVFTRRVARVQTSRELSQEEQDALHVLLLNGTGDGNTPEHAKQIEIAYQPAVMDPEHTAIEKMLTSVDFGDQIEAVKLSTIYAFEGLTEEELETLVNKYLFNPLLHVIIIPESTPKLTTQAEAE